MIVEKQLFQKSQATTQTKAFSSVKNDLVGPPGFEPESRESKNQRKASFSRF
jgi:hypothetical protein